MVKADFRRSKTRNKSSKFESILVYNYLKSVKRRLREPELSAREILNGVCDTYNLPRSPLIRKQIIVALRRGINYGIVKKINKKYSFDEDSSEVSAWKQECSRANCKKKPGKPATPKRQPVPRPRVPKPPTFKQRQRNLREEPMPRIRKHKQQHLPDVPKDPPF